MKTWNASLFFLVLSIGLSGLIEGGCVSQSERLAYRPHLVQQDEGVWDEVKREFGWQTSSKTKKKRKNQQESLYSKMTRRAKEWFQNKEPPYGDGSSPASLRAYQPGIPARAKETGSTLKP
jgi:hypothetical protein